MSNLLHGAPSDLLVSVRNVYGNDLVYPVCERAKLLAELTGKTTFTEQAIATLKKLGFTFVLTSARNAVMKMTAQEFRNVAFALAGRTDQGETLTDCYSNAVRDYANAMAREDFTRAAELLIVVQELIDRKETTTGAL